MPPTPRRIDFGAVITALPEAVALTLLAALPAFINLASERIFEEEKVLLLRAAALVALPGVVMAWRRQGTRLIRNPIVLAFAAFVVMLFIAAAIGVAPRDAFAGAYLRRHGMLTWLALFTLFCAMCVSASSRAGRERLLAAIVVGSVWPSIYALLQWAGVDPVTWAGVDLTRAVSALGSSIYLGGYLAAVIPLTAFFVRKSKGWAAVLVLQFAALVSSGSRGPLVALTAAACVFVVVAGWAQISRRAVIAAALALAIGVAAAMAVRNPGNRLLDASRGSARIHVLIWRGVVTLMRNSGGRLWIGYGPESLHRVFPPYYVPDIGRIEGTDAMPDRAHNETLDTLVSAGIAGVVLQYVLFAAILAGMLRIEDRWVRAALCAAAAGHLIEIQFGIASAVSRLVFFAIAAIAVGAAAPEPEEAAHAISQKDGRRRGRAAPAAATAAPIATPWWWLSLAAAAAACSPWLSMLTSRTGSSAMSGTAADLVSYLSDISLATPLLYVVILATALILAGAIAAPSSDSSGTWIRAVALGASLLVAVPLSITPSRADIFSKAGAALESQQQWLEASIAYREASGMQPAEPYYLAGLGRSLVQQALKANPADRAGYVTSARAAFERAYALNPSDPDHARHLAGLFRISAAMRDEGGRAEPLAEADRIYAGVTQFAPGLPALWLEWAYTDLDRQQLPAALEKLARVLTLDDSRVDAWTLRGQVHLMQGRADEALADYNQALARDRRAVTALRGRAIALAGLKRFSEARATIADVLAIAPGDSESLRIRAQLGN
jgi:tetratricopeptide (TPR) repeat protein/O-antigen ligase